MKFKSPIALALIATASMPLTQALAADYDPPIYVDQAPEYTPVEIGSGWYLRGDVAYLPQRTYQKINFPTTDLSERDRHIFGSVGFGYHFSDYVRGDINLGLLPGNKIDLATLTPGVDESTARVRNSAHTLMVNGYVDLGTVVGVTPYLGAGIGMMRSKYDFGLNYDDFATPSVDVTASDNKTQYTFAYSLNAGLAYQISKNVVADLGYQYLSSPNAKYATIDSASAYSIRKGVDSHQIKVGLRYDLW